MEVDPRVVTVGVNQVVAPASNLSEDANASQVS